MIPGVSLVAKMFLPLTAKLSPPLAAYGINWPFHKGLPVTYMPKPEVEDKEAFLEKFIDAKELAKYVLFALFVLNGRPPKTDSAAAGLLAVDSLSPDMSAEKGLPMGFGHSAGATALLMTEFLFPGTFAALFLYEPVLITDRSFTSGEVTEEIASLITRTLERKSVFSSPGNAKDHFRNRMPFADMDPACLDFYLKDALCHGVGPDRESRLILDRSVEAKFYGRFGAMGKIPSPGTGVCPVHVLTGSRDNKVASYSLENLKDLLPNIQTTVLDGLDHFGPFTAPERVASVINAGRLPE